MMGFVASSISNQADEQRRRNIGPCVRLDRIVARAEIGNDDGLVGIIPALTAALAILTVER
jgi:hypothetical protein